MTTLKTHTHKSQREILLSTLLEMFKQRGYTEITVKDREQCVKCLDDRGKITCALYAPYLKLDTATVRQISKFATETGIQHGIFIYQEAQQNVNTNLANLATIQQTQNIEIEVFPALNLYYIPTWHELVPEHVRVVRPELVVRPEPVEAKSNLDSTLKKEFKNLPILTLTDPTAQFLGFRKDDLIKIINRKDKSVSYRRVV